MAWWYPHDKPVIYSYTSAFTEKESLHGSEAKEHIDAQKNLVGASVSDDGKTGQAIVELNRMIGMARAAEQQFLAKYGFINVGNDWNALITGINLILSTKESFERNVQLLKQYTDNDDNTKEYQDVALYFKKYLQTAIYEEIDVNVNESAYTILNRAVKNAISKMANMTDTKLQNGTIITKNPNNTKENGTALQAFVELFKIIQVFHGCNFLARLGEIFQLEDYINEVKKRLSQGQNTQLELQYSGNGNPGTLSEIIYSAVAEGLGAGTANGGRIRWATVEQPGGYNYKPDRYLASINVSYDQSAQNVKNNGKNYNNSTRARGIDTMRDLYQQIEQAKGDIVLVSDKNYIINNAFHKRGGFKAQDETSLNALSGLFNSLDITGFDINAMINYLANIGSNLVEKQIDNQILRAISAQIGNFLFDDLSFSSIPVNANIIHVFNLSGVYVPLSIVLEGVAHGLQNISSVKLESYVSVKFSASSDVPGKWTKDEAPWTAFRNTKMKNNKLKIHFLQDFAAIIASSVQF